MKTNLSPSFLQGLVKFPWREWHFAISSRSTSSQIEDKEESLINSDYNSRQFNRLLVALLEEREHDFTGPALEIGCGSGLLTSGLVASGLYSSVFITDSSAESLAFTRRRLVHHDLADPGKVFFATMDNDQLGCFPDNTFSLIVLHSVVRHSLNAKEFITTARRALKPGGVIICEELCAEGCKVIGLLAQFVPMVMENAGKPLNDGQCERLRLFAESMVSSLSSDMSHSGKEGKHHFRLLQMMKEANLRGLSSEFFSDLTLGEHLNESSDSKNELSGFRFLTNYLREAMYLDGEFAATLDKALAPYAAFLENFYQDVDKRPWHGVYLLSKSKSEQVASKRRAGLNIATLNTYDLHGGAARAAWRLHKGLLEIGLHSRMLVLHRSSEEPEVLAVTTDSSEDTGISLTDWSRAAYVTINRHRTTLSETYFTAPVPSYDLSLHPSVRASDIVNLHWVSGMISPDGIQALQSLNKPIVWTLHDQRAFTGGCHYSAGCVGYQSECDACPQLDSSVSHLPHRILREAVSKIDPRHLTVVCPSKWLADCARQSAVFRNCRIEVIPYGLETELYVPCDQASARRSLGLPPNGFCFLFGAHSANERRKGTHILLEAAHIAKLDPSFQEALENGNVFFLTYGCDSEKRDYQGIPIFSLGYIEDVEKMTMAYAASDIYVCPTLEDNLPNTVLESLSCGRPVIGSNVGGVPDMVRDGINGRLFPVGDSHALAEIIIEVIRKPEALIAWGMAARRGIEAEHRLQLQADRYRHLYEDLLQDINPTPEGLPPARDEPPLLPLAWDFAALDPVILSSPGKENGQSIRLDAPSGHDSSRTKVAESSGRNEWPYKSPAQRTIPVNLPSGRPWPRISIVTPSYNQGRYIEQTILSIANQNYPNVEHIIIDGGSTDETVAMLNKYSPLLSFWASEKDGSQIQAINKGFSMATGEIISWLNCEDLLTPGALAAIAFAFDTSSADMVAGICQLNCDGVISSRYLASLTDGPLPIAELLDLENHWISGQFFLQPEVFFKRDLLLKVGGSVNENARLSMDCDLWVRFAQAGASLKVISRPVAQLRVHGEQKHKDLSGLKAELQTKLDRMRKSSQVSPSPTQTTGRKQKLKIIFFNDIGLNDSAGIAHQRLAQAASMAGHEVLPVTVASNRLTEDEKALPFAKQIVPSLLALSPDVVVVGNIHSANLESSFLIDLAEAIPTVFVLHDSWVLSRRTTEPDQTSFTPYGNSSFDLARIASSLLKKEIRDQTASSLLLAANSCWTRQQIEAAATALHIPADLPFYKPMKVCLSVPLDVFLPRDQASCRKELELPSDKFILLFSCSDLNGRRDGMDHLIQAIQKLDLPDLLPICIGYNGDSPPADLQNLINFGNVRDPHKMAMLYSAADLFVAPSLENYHELRFVEAAACGTPSVAYPIQGIPESLIDGISGSLAKRVDPEALAEAIMKLYLNRRLCLNLGWWGRCHVENEFSQEAASRTLFFALREAVRLGGSDLVPKLELQSTPDQLPATTVLLDSLGFIKPPPAETNQLYGRQIDLIMLNHYQSQLAYFRTRTTPWWLKPKAWLAKINRDSLRAKIARSESKQKRSDTASK